MNEKNLLELAMESAKHEELVDKVKNRPKNNIKLLITENNMLEYHLMNEMSRKMFDKIVEKNKKIIQDFIKSGDKSLVIN